LRERGRRRETEEKERKEEGGHVGEKRRGGGTRDLTSPDPSVGKVVVLSLD
jgi:hypothetical protein